MMQADAHRRVGARLTRRRRARLSVAYEDSARLPKALADRLVEHLIPIRRDPARILELGAATGYLRAELKRLYPRSQVISGDDCLSLLVRNPKARWPRRSRELLCTTGESLPLASASVDMVVCNLDLLRAVRVEAALNEWRRVLRHDGVVMLATLGPLSFKELVAAWGHLDPEPHLDVYPDMHDLGDSMVRAGFRDVVMDSERLCMEFDHLSALLRELHTVGGGNTRPDRRRSLTTRKTLARLEEQYRELMSGPGCWATVEAVFAHGWVVEGPGVEVAPPRRLR